MTQYPEERALTLAMEDIDADSGNSQPLDDHLNGLPEADLRRLAEASDHLGRRAWAALQRKRAEA